MFDIEELPALKRAIRTRAHADKKLLDELRDEVHSFACEVHTIKPRSTTAISLVASDGGNNELTFDPFFVQLVRVMDSYGKQLCLDAVSPTTDTEELSKNQFNSDGSPKTALGKMMIGLGVEPPTLNRLSYMIPDGRTIRERPEGISQSWVLNYRDLCEWAVLYERICHDSFATDTLIVRDGLLRSMIFRGEFFMTWRKKVEEAIARIYHQDHRQVFLVGVAKYSKVITRYQLAMAIEDIFPSGEAQYVRIPRELEAKAYIKNIYARGPETEGDNRESPKYVAGDLYLVRFGRRSSDPVWAVDILSQQSQKASEIFGYLLSDAIDGFPVQFYPRCLQKAHEHAQVVDFDFDIFQDEIFKAVRDLLPPEKQNIIEYFRFNSDLSSRRYR
jgi:hypothetical protein